MPKNVFNADYSYLPRSELLTFEEIIRVARAAVTLGVEKIRLTGGEPLLRKDLPTLIRHLANLRTTHDTAVDLTLTTNGSLLDRYAPALADAGLKRITVSLDALDDSVFKQMNDVDFAVQDVLDGITAAEKAGFQRIKINMVVRRGVNDQEIVPMAQYFKKRGHIMRFIEFMDVGNTNGWRMDDVVSGAEIITQLQRALPLMPLEADYRGEVAQRWQYADGSGEIGVITSVTRAFCSDCTRARLSTDGHLYLCLFASQGYPLRPWLRKKQSSEADLQALLREIWRQRTDRYSELRGREGTMGSKVEMSFIGG